MCCVGWLQKQDWETLPHPPVIQVCWSCRFICSSPAALVKKQPAWNSYWLAQGHDSLVRIKSILGQISGKSWKVQELEAVVSRPGWKLQKIFWSTFRYYVLNVFLDSRHRGSVSRIFLESGIAFQVSFFTIRFGTLRDARRKLKLKV